MIQTVSSYETINNQYVSSSPSDLISVGQEDNGPECLSKNLILNILYRRHRRASISRPYFYPGRGSRDDARYLSKSILAFSPRLGKRSNEDENESDIFIPKRQLKGENKPSDLETFLAILAIQLQRKQIDIIYEDSTKICLSQTVSDALIQEVIDKLHAYRRQQDIEEQQSKSKHPLMFRYRLG